MNESPAIRLDTLISATDLGRTPGQFIARAADGERVVVLNQNKAVAALVSIDDLRRLDHLDRDPAGPVDSPPTGDATPLTVPAGHATIGHTGDGRPVTVKLTAHTLVAGMPGSGLSTTLSAMLAHAHYGATTLEFLLATADPRPPRLVHTPLEKAPQVSVFTGDEADSPFTTRVSDELQRRTELFREAGVANLTEWNATLGAPQLPELVIAVDPRAWETLSGRFKWELVSRVLADGRWLGISLWSFADATPLHPHRTNPQGAFDQIIAHRVRTSADSRALLSDRSAATLRMPGQAYLLTSADPDKLTLFTVTAPNT